MRWLRSLIIGLLGVIGGIFGNLIAAIVEGSLGQITFVKVGAIIVGIFLTIALAVAIERQWPKDKIKQLQELEQHRRELHRLESLHQSGVHWTSSHVHAWADHQKAIAEIKYRLKDKDIPDDRIDCVPSPKLGLLTRVIEFIRRNPVLRFLILLSLALLLSREVEDYLLTPTRPVAPIATPTDTPPPILTDTPVPMPPTAMATPTTTPTYTQTPMPIATPTSTSTPTATPTPTFGATPTATTTSTGTPTSIPTSTPVPAALQPTGPIALTIYLRDTLVEDFVALSDDRVYWGEIYEEGKCVYGEAAVQIGETTYRFDRPEVAPGEPEQLPDPWRVEFEFAKNLKDHTTTAKGDGCAEGTPGFDPKKAQFWVGILNSESAADDNLYSLTMRLYQGDELQESIQVFFTVKDAP